MPTIPYLAPPVDPDYAPGSLNSPGFQILSFRHNSENDIDDFKGYDLYYKLYPPEGYPGSAIATDEAVIETTPRDTGARRLQSRGFLKLVPVTNRDGDPSGVQSIIIGQPRPQLELDPTSSAISFSVDLRSPHLSDRDDPEGIDTDPTKAEIVVTWEQGGDVFARGFRRRNVSELDVSNPDDVYAGFWDQSTYRSDDYDISRMFPADVFDLTGDFNYEMTIVLYAVTYGQDGRTFQDYYSVPLRLKEGTIVVPSN